VTPREDFNKIIDENRRRLHRICCVYGDSIEDREDLFQEIVFTVWKSLPTFDERCSLQTWIYRIALNVSLLHRQKRGSEQRKQEQKINEVIATSHLRESEVEEDYERKEKLHFIQNFVRALKDPDRTVTLLYLEDLPQSEISDITGLSQGAVSVRIHRIKKRLMNEMGRS